MSWNQELRRFQNERQNAGWRIHLIPCDDATRPMAQATNWPVLLGAGGFLLALYLLVRHRGGAETTYFALAIGSLLFAFFGAWFQARRRRKGWAVIAAHCVDRELKEIRLPKGGRGWLWRIVCEHEYGGTQYRVTPNVTWTNFTSEASAMKFIEHRITPNSECKIHVNPNNPLETELVGQGITDKLLY